MPPKWVYTVDYTNEQCKLDAINALKAIAGVSAENDQRGRLSTKVTVTVIGQPDRQQIPYWILQIFGTVRKKVVVFNVTFRDSRHKNDAITLVEALKGAGQVEFKPPEDYGSNTLLPLKVPGDADPNIVLKILQKYGTAQFD